MTDDPSVPSSDEDEIADEVKLTDRAENPADAKLKAKAGLEDANSARFEGNITLEGNPLLVGGNTVKITGLGKLDGDYLIESSKHSIIKDHGYTTDIEVRRA
ncbi:MAG: hypothetical protein HQK81_06100 [Desulfovibrionaceae bacterium]|nr:hypothetical protein [Desulfovibrionaceae bacterium]MBF0513621.1 hypothetical protein [Desulfovibrionaceae bacterium]